MNRKVILFSTWLCCILGAVFGQKPGRSGESELPPYLINLIDTCAIENTEVFWNSSFEKQVKVHNSWNTKNTPLK